MFLSLSRSACGTRLGIVSSRSVTDEVQNPIYRRVGTGCTEPLTDAGCATCNARPCQWSAAGAHQDSAECVPGDSYRVFPSRWPMDGCAAAGRGMRPRTRSDRHRSARRRAILGRGPQSWRLRSALATVLRARSEAHFDQRSRRAGLARGRGGSGAEGVMLGQPLYMLTPQVVGFKLTGRLRDGVTATDLVLTVTQMLRKKGVVDKFVEFHGPGVSAMSLPDRATIANMAPEY